MRFICSLASVVLLTGIPADKVRSEGLTWTRVEAVVHEALSRNTNYLKGDLISQADVEPIINALLDLGFRLDDVESIYDDFLPSNHYLVHLSYGEVERRFMRQIAGVPQAYDRLERLSWSTKGRSLLQELARQPDGPALFKKLLAGGEKLFVAVLNDEAAGKKFLLPTGHLHTEEALLKWLRRAYDRQATRR